MNVNVGDQMRAAETHPGRLTCGKVYRVLKVHRTPHSSMDRYQTIQVECDDGNKREFFARRFEPLNARPDFMVGSLR
jgi:hypothetical protein